MILRRSQLNFAWARLRPAVLLLALLAGAATAGSAADFAPLARQWDLQLREQILPYWHDTAQDRARGGYLLADDGTGPREPREKQLVSQARMVWTFAHVHRKGYSTRERSYLRAARQGARFLVDRFRDREHGGYFWKLDLAGNPVNDRKFLYGEAFVVYALVEYYRASGEPWAVRRALELYRAIQEHCHDRVRRGWLEHHERDWTPILTQDNRIEVEVAGWKSANAHLHWMEALSELYAATGLGEVRDALWEALDLNARYFYPRPAGAACFHRQLDWQPVTAARSAGLSYGHNVEFAWLMLRAQDVLGHAPWWGHFFDHIDHALRFGYDHQRGGMFNRGMDDQPASDTSKVWWVQAEALAALTDAVKQRPGGGYDAALEQLIAFLQLHQADARDGVWRDTLRADGTPVNRAKAHQWKANYHDVRALVKFIEAFR